MPVDSRSFLGGNFQFGLPLIIASMYGLPVMGEVMPALPGNDVIRMSHFSGTDIFVPHVRAHTQKL